MFPKFDAQVPGHPLNWSEFRTKVARKGIDIDKFGRTTFLGMALSGGGADSSETGFELVFLVSAAAIATDKLKRKESQDGVALYTVPQKPSLFIAVMGNTAIMGSKAAVQRIVRVGVGRSPRLGARAPLRRSIRDQRAAMPRLRSVVVADLSSLRKHLPNLSKMWVGNLKWVSGLRSVGFFLEPERTTIQLRGKAESLEEARTLLAQQVISAFWLVAAGLTRAKPFGRMQRPWSG